MSDFDKLKSYQLHLCCVCAQTGFAKLQGVSLKALTSSWKMMNVSLWRQIDIMQYINVLCKTTNQIDFKKSMKLFYQCLSRNIQKAINNQNVNFDKTLMTVISFNFNQATGRGHCSLHSRFCCGAASRHHGAWANIDWNFYELDASQWPAEHMWVDWGGKLMW